MIAIQVPAQALFATMPDTMTISDGDIAVWPDGQTVREPAASLYWTRFEDRERFEQPLKDVIDRIFERDFKRERPETGALGGRKIHHVDLWGIPEATLIDERAKQLFRIATGSAEAHVDLSWANIYQDGDHIGPHAHERALASVVYSLDEGEPDSDPNAGELFLVDPRLEVCCGHAPGIMTTPFRFNLSTGCMVLFPGHAVHYVAPYRGKTQPRITLAWNINAVALPGSFKDDHADIPERVPRVWD